MPPSPPPQPPGSLGLADAEVARYVAEMCAELRQLTAVRPALRTTGYLLDMARLESERVATGAPGAGRTAGPSPPPQIGR